MDKNRFSEIRQILYRPEEYIVNDKQLAQVVNTYLNSRYSDKLFIFGHTGIGKSAIVQRTAQQNQMEIQNCTKNDIDAGISNVKADIIEIECSIRDLYDNPKSILALDLPKKIIVEVTVNHEGDARNFIMDNPDAFYWVYYRETAEDSLTYMKETNANPLMIKFITQNPDRISSLQVEECDMYQKGILSISEAMSILENHQDTKQLGELIVGGMQHLVSATISDEPIAIPAQSLASSLWQNKEEIEDKVLVLKLGIILTRDMPYVGNFYRAIK